jgi:hypothetical protein
MGAFEFVVIASLRSAQLARGCTPKTLPSHKHTVTAQWEVLMGHVTSNVAVQTRVVDEPEIRRGCSSSQTRLAELDNAVDAPSAQSADSVLASQP